VSAWAVAGQSLSLIVGGVGLGLGIAFGGMLWHERDRATDLQDALLTETLERYEVNARLGVCQASRAALIEGQEIDREIPNNLDDFVLPDDWRVLPESAGD